MRYEDTDPLITSPYGTIATAGSTTLSAIRERLLVHFQKIFSDVEMPTDEIGCLVMAALRSLGTRGGPSATSRLVATPKTLDPA